MEIARHGGKDALLTELRKQELFTIARRSQRNGELAFAAF
jgi:hypothetical protein